MVEDEPGIVDFVRRGLEAEGFAVEAALDGLEGERLALREAFEAYLLVLRSFHAGDADAAGLEEAAERLRERARACIRSSSTVHG